MKKFLTIMLVLSMAAISANASEQTNMTTTENVQQAKQQIKQSRAQREAAFEQKLGLTDAQKTQARELRQKGFEKIKPVMEQIRLKHQEAAAVKRSKIAVQEQELRLTKIDEELKVLEKQAREIRKENMKEFEKILTKEQKKILKEMKKEGRENFKKNHPHGKPYVQHYRVDEVKEK